MKIAIHPSLITPVRNGSCFGGEPISALQLAEALAERGHSVTLVGLAGSGGVGLSVLEGFPATPALGTDDLSPPGLGPFAETMATLGSMSRRGELDVLHLHCIDRPALIEADRLARREPLLRVVSTLHVAATYREVIEAVRALVADRTPIVFTAPSRYAAESYGPVVAPRIQVVRNGIDTRHVAWRRDPPSNGGLVWAGRRSPEKGLAAAFEIALAAGRSITVAGDLPAGQEPVRIPDGLRVLDRGYLARALLLELLPAAEGTLITSSIAEAQPLIALESLACGTPVVAFDVGGMREVVEHGVTGFLVPPGDIAHAVHCVRRLRDIDRAVCRETAVKKLDLHQSVEAFERIYRREKVA